MVEVKSYTPEHLRMDVRSAELAVAALHRGVPPQSILDLLRLLDRLSDGVERLSKANVDLRAELSRIETVHNSLLEKDRLVVKKLAGLGGLSRLRREVDPAADRWWWYLDRRIAESRTRQARRMLWTLVGVGAVLSVLVLLYMLFLRPDEATRLRLNYEMSAESQIERGDYEAALALYEQALVVAPEDPEIHLMIGMMNEVLGHSQDATDQYDEAERLYGERKVYLAAKSQKYLLLGWYEESESAALEAIKIDDQYALAYCNLGSAYEGQNRISEAVAMVQTCADLAREQGQDELYVIAASRLAMLLQRPLSPGTSGSEGQQNQE